MKIIFTYHGNSANENPMTLMSDLKLFNDDLMTISRFLNLSFFDNSFHVWCQSRFIMNLIDVGPELLKWHPKHFTKF